MNTYNNTRMTGHANDTLVSYVSDPDNRGTPTLVLSCLLTLILCAWSALHLNVPAPGQTRWQLIKLNLKWIVVGIYGPELVAFSAWRQWSSARLLLRTVNGLHKRKDDSEADMPSRHPWTMTHSFFASTGGFVIDCEPYLCKTADSDGFLGKNVPKRITVSARGIELLAKRGELPNLSKAEIEDKSKSDALGKTLVLTQALWFLTQIIARLAAGLPVTLLEVNTVAHVICTLLLYSLWWHKPYLAREPIVLTSPAITNLLPFMFMSSEISGKVREGHIRSGSTAERLFRFLNVYSGEPEIICLCSQPPLEKESSGNDVKIVKDAVVTKPSDVDDQPPSLSLSMDEECITLMEAERVRRANDTIFLERRPKIYNDISLFHQDFTFTRRLSRLNSVIQSEDAIVTESFRHELRDGRICRHFEGQEMVCDYIKNWPYNDLLQSANGLVIGVILWSANFCYGGIHAAAWNDHFPSVLEKWLWRSSAIYISYAGGLWVCINILMKKVPRVGQFFQDWVAGSSHFLNYLWLGITVCVNGCCFIFARVYLVVGAFLCVRSLPQSAYDMPQWSQIFPHF